MEFALKAENVSIRYITGDFKDIGIKEYVSRKATHNYRVNEFMAVDGVSFTLERGDMLGIVGTNGAGKSTLLKAVSGIMEPTKGKITANGEVAALLELGSGFDGDLTVKENAYLRGAMLGYTKEFMDETYDHIIDFAELREFENRPFKQLSSGMKSRLAFSIASLVKPDILILDEVLSVGDGAFQEKSAKKMREIISQGATTILVSHSLAQIRELCNKVLWLDHGKQVMFGDTEEVCDLYEKYLNGEHELVSKLLHPSDETEKLQTEVKPENHLQEHGGKIISKPLRALNAFIMAAFFTFVLFNIGTNVDFLSTTQAQTTVLIYSETVGANVTYRGAEVDGVWVSPWDNVPDHGNWLFDEENATYTATDNTPLTVEIPQGKERTITFNVGPDEGSVRVEQDGKTTHFDLNQSEAVDLGLPFLLPEMQDTFSDANSYILIFAALIILFIIFYILGEKEKRQAKGGREIWGDVLRIFCCYCVILSHNTCNLFPQYMEGRTSILLPLVFTAFCVPCFYMISGAYLLRKPQGIAVTLKSRVPKIVIPTLFWGSLFLLMFGEAKAFNFIKLLFKENETHFWFMYSLFGIYMLLPFVSKLYHNISLNEKIYGLVLLLAIPTCIYDASKLVGIWVPTPPFAIFWPDLGIFLLGAVIWDCREKLIKVPKFALLLEFLMGFALTTFETVYICGVTNTPDKTFIAAIGSVGNLMMATSCFVFVLSCEKVFQQKLSHKVAACINEIGSVTMGVYMIHVIFLRTVNNSTTNGLLPIYSNAGSLVDMVWGAFVYLVICTVICLSASKIKFINRLF